MATSPITANIVVNFDTGEDGQGILLVEVDDRTDGLNNGITSFVPGDNVGFLVFKSSNVTVNEIVVSAGSVSTAGSQTKEISDFLIFAKEKQANFRYPVSSGFSSKWLGNDLGGFTRTDAVINLSTDTPGVGVLKVDYNSTAQGYRLTNVPTVLNGETSFQILIYVAGTVTT